MLSVFITPCTKPTRIQSATMRAVRSHTCREPLRSAICSLSLDVPELSSGKSRRIVKSISWFSSATSPRAAGSSKLPKRMNDGATRHTIAPGSMLGVAVVEHVPHDLFAGRHQAQCARRGHAEVMHRFAAQKLAHRRAQHRAAVGGARIGRRPCALELQLPALALRVDHFAQRDRAAITELPGPVAELVPAVVGRIGLHAIDAARCRRTPAQTPAMRLIDCDRYPAAPPLRANAR